MKRRTVGMTNFEYLKKRTNGLGVSDDDIELILLKGEFNGNDPVNIKDYDIGHCSMKKKAP